MKRLQIPQKSVCEVAAMKKFYVHKIDAVDLSIFLSINLLPKKRKANM